MAFYKINNSGKSILSPEEVPNKIMSHTFTFCGQQIVLFGGTDGSKASGKLYLYDILTNNWSEPFKSIKNNIPAARFSHVGLFDPPEELYIYGGTDGLTVFGDLWIYNLRTISWKKVEGLFKPPTPRFGHFGALFAEKLYYFAGKGGNENSHNAVDRDEVIVYDLIRRQWTLEVPVTKFGDIKGPNYSAVQSLDLISMYIIGKATNKLYIYNFLTNAWKVQMISGIQPSRRIRTTLCHAYENALLMFGGMDGNNYYNDMNLLFYNEHEFYWDKIDFTGINVKPRIGHSLTNVSEGIFMYGGGGRFNEKFDIFSDFYYLDLSRVPTWEVHEQGGAPPIPVALHVMVLLEGKAKLFIHGGMSEDKILHNAYFFDLKEWVWEIIDSFRKFPLAGHSGVYHQTRDLVYLHGGANEKQVMMQMLSFNTESKEFREMITSKMPPARSGHISFIYKEIFYIFGGYSATGGYYNELYTLDLEALEWKLMKTQTLDENPKPDGRIGASFTIHKNLLLLIGGIKNGKVLDDIWYFDLDFHHWRKPDLVNSIPIRRFGHISEFIDDKRVIIFGGASIFHNREPQDILDKSMLIRIEYNNDYVAKLKDEAVDFEHDVDLSDKGMIKNIQLESFMADG